jgi:hypothetical protein
MEFCHYKTVKNSQKQSKTERIVKLCLTKEVGRGIVNGEYIENRKG